MKRLIKKANSQYEDFLYDLLYENEFSPQQVDEIIHENPDCVYNGTAYRIFFFDKSEIKSIGLELTESFDNDLDDLVPEVIKQLINTNGAYHSFSKTLNGIKVVKEDIAIEGSLPLIITISVQNGLDIAKLFDKYSNTFNEDTFLDYSKFENEEEVLVRLNNDYTIKEDEDIYYYLYELINGDPTEY